MVQQPTKGSTVAANVKGDVGHAFIRVDHGDGTVNYFGFYPSQSTNDLLFLDLTVPGRINTELPALIEGLEDLAESNHPWDIGMAFDISIEQAAQIVDFATNYDKAYNLISNNCTTFAVQALEIVGIQHPIEQHDWDLPFYAGMYGRRKLRKNYGYSREGAKSRYDELVDNLYGYTPGDAGEDIRNYN